MAENITVDKTELRGFIAAMRSIATEMSAVHPDMARRYGRADGDTAAAYRNGAKLTLGSIDHPHPGRVAGELLADRAAEVLGFVKSLEEGARALGEAAQGVLDGLGDRDTLSAAELARIEAATDLNPFDD